MTARASVKSVGIGTFMNVCGPMNGPVFAELNADFGHRHLFAAELK